jgi:aerobic-type carbon monoxide dehydrogenase small subunit (CoxS/CutS family)
VSTAPTTPEPSRAISFRVNGRPVEVTGDPTRRLVDVLRYDLDLTGTKESCAVGVCGACSVVVDGRLVSACLLPVGLLGDAEVTTIEGIASPDGGLTEVQDAFIAKGGFQCGACTPGQIVAATALLETNPRPSDAEIREWMGGNYCRCTGYTGIVAAIREASEQITARADGW